MSAPYSIVAVEPREGFVLHLVFRDGTSGDLDVSGELWGEIFEPLKDQAAFRKVRVDSASGTIVWPNGADLAPDVLYERIRRNSVAKTKTG